VRDEPVFAGQGAADGKCRNEVIAPTGVDHSDEHAAAGGQPMDLAQLEARGGYVVGGLAISRGRGAALWRTEPG
jgi:hypothetical protein